MANRMVHEFHFKNAHIKLTLKIFKLYNHTALSPLIFILGEVITVVIA